MSVLRKIFFGGIVAIVLAFGGLKWTEHTARQTIEDRFSSWVNRNSTTENLSLGLFESTLFNIKIPTASSTGFTNDVEAKAITIAYNPLEASSELTTIKKLEIEGLIVNWNGLFGNNIQTLINNIKTTFPKRARKRNRESEDAEVEIEHIELTNTTVIVHLGPSDTTIVLPSLTLKNVQGTHQSIVKQIVEQIRIGMR